MDSNHRLVRFVLSCLTAITGVWLQQDDLSLSPPPCNHTHGAKRSFLFVTTLCACHPLLVPRPGHRPSNTVYMICASSHSSHLSKLASPTQQSILSPPHIELLHLTSTEGCCWHRADVALLSQIEHNLLNTELAHQNAGFGCLIKPAVIYSYPVKTLSVLLAIPLLYRVYIFQQWWRHLWLHNP